MTRAKTIAAALLGCALFGWATFNIGFDIGSDVSGCVAFDVTTDIPAKDNPFCVRAQIVETAPVHVARESWLIMIGESHGE